MRRYDIVSRTLLILSIIDVALAAPVLAQEKCQAYLGVVYNPEPSVADTQDEFLSAHALRNPGSSTEPDYELTGVPGILSTPVLEDWYDADYHLVEAYPPQRNPGPSNPRPSSELDLNNRFMASQPSRPQSGLSKMFDAGHDLQMVYPPPLGEASLTDSEHETVNAPPSSLASSTDSNHESMSADSQLKNLQAVSDALKGQAIESLPIPGTARDVVNAVQIPEGVAA